MKIELWDSFNNHLISKHHSIENAILARTKHHIAVKKMNGEYSHINYDLLRPDGSPVNPRAIELAEFELDSR